MRTNLVNAFFPAGFPGMSTNFNYAIQAQGVISSDVSYISALCYYDTTATSASIYDNQNLIQVTQKYKANVSYTIGNVGGIALYNNSLTQQAQDTFQTPQGTVLGYAANKQYSMLPLNQLNNLLLLVKLGEVTGAIELGYILYALPPVANSTELELITYYAFKPDTTVDVSGYIELPYSIAVKNLPTNNTFLYNGTGLSLCRVQYRGGM